MAVQSVSLTSNQYLTSLVQGLSFHTTTDEHGIIFELVPCDKSATYSIIPTSETTLNKQGFTDVSSVAEINVSAASLSNLFYFYSSDFSYGYDFSNNPTENLMLGNALYGINRDFSFNRQFSKAYIRQGTISGNGTQQIDDDYVRYLSDTVFGVPNVVDLFSNTTELINGVISMDDSFNTIFTNDISNAAPQPGMTNTGVTNKTGLNGCRLYLDSSANVLNNGYVDSCKQLVDGFLSIAGTARGITFFNKLKIQAFAAYNAAGYSDASGVVGDPYDTLFYIPFEIGDKLSLKITYIYNPAPGNLNTFPVTSIPSRSYKIVLSCTS
uniref:Uncharacterized protein n=1 Tax=viral metagenome TaxID=1070528 RepID=A0A6C0EUZ2_9ZZZZ